MFEQHPVPQQISSYQFRLVGDMTIKQFFQIAAGAIVALIIYGLPFPSVIKWPLIVIAALGGAAFAFLPIQDRPLEQWLVAFFRSIYSPTYFVWQVQNPAPQYFKQPDQGQPIAAAPVLTPEQEHAKDLKEGVQEEVDTGVIPDFIAGVNASAEPTQQVGVGASLQQDVDNSLQGKILSDSSIVQQAPQAQEKKEVVIPQSEAVNVEAKGINTPAQVQMPVQTPANDIYTAQVSQVTHNQDQSMPTTQAQFSADAAPPLPPNQPNTIKGQVMDSSGHIVDGAILEIKDSAGRPVRALRSNKAGHFQIVTSLPNGQYTITIEKEGYVFDPLSITAVGELINPIAIRANNTI